jgi:hypothetical protein
MSQLSFRPTTLSIDLSPRSPALVKTV